MAFGLVLGCQELSDLLTIRERRNLTTLLEPHCKLIKSTVAQILEASDTSGQSSRWKCVNCGVLCLIEDESAGSYFLRLYCVTRTMLLWEQEMFVPFEYTVKQAYFHTFPGEECQIGLNFANEVEADEFYSAVHSVHEKLSNLIELSKGKTVSSSSSDNLPSENEFTTTTNEEESSSIFAPTPVNYSITSSFQDIDPVLGGLMTHARLSEKDLKEKNVEEVVDCIINKFGGLKAVRKELRARGGISRTVSKGTGASISLALERVPSISNGTAAVQGPLDSQFGSVLPCLSPTPVPEGIKKSVTFRYPSKENNDDVVTALREVFRQKKMLKQKSTEDANQAVLEKNN